MYVNGELVEKPERVDVTNPYTGACVGQVGADGPAEVAWAVASLKSYKFDFGPEQRASVLRRAADALLAQRDSFARLIVQESGNCLKDGLKEVDRAVGNLQVAAEEARRLNGEALPLGGAAGRMALTLHDPVGVVLAITPFNRPLNQVVVKVAPALAAGNAVLVKPSEKTPLSALAFARLMIEAGLPPNMLAVVTGRPGEVGPLLLQSDGIDMITFTGSVATGEAISRGAGMRRTLLELGGNDPLIVLGDADLAVAVKIAAEGATATAGQSCRGIKRIIVAESVADAFAPLLAKAVAARRIGDPMSPDTDIGCVIDEAAAAHAERRVRETVRAGAKLLCGGGRKGCLVEPTVLDHVPPDSEMVRHETFAPFAPIIRVRDVEEAIAVANGTEYGLQAGVVTRDHHAFTAIARGLRVGGVALMDGPQFDSPLIPFGGVKKSGLGREGIRFAMREMTTLKTIVMPW